MKTFQSNAQISQPIEHTPRDRCRKKKKRNENITKPITAQKEAIFDVIIWCISCRKFEARAFICFIDLRAAPRAEEELLTA